MNVLSKEELDKLQAASEYLIQAVSDPATREYYRLALRARLETIQRREAAKRPVAWIVGSEEIDDFKCGREVMVMRDDDEEELEKVPLYSEPTLTSAERERLAAYDRAAKEPAYWVYDTKFGLDISKEKPEYEENTEPYFPVFTAPPLPVVPDEKRSERFDWSFGDWARHLGGRHQGGDPANYYEFGSFMAVAEMLKQFGIVQQKSGWNACRAAMLQSTKNKL